MGQERKNRIRTKCKEVRHTPGNSQEPINRCYYDKGMHLILSIFHNDNHKMNGGKVKNNGHDGAGYWKKIYYNSGNESWGMTIHERLDNKRKMKRS